MAETSTEFGTCLVCTTPINSIHFGIDACRACSSFFKRAKLSGKKYPCRQGGRGKCVITRGENFVCRRCRYEKCVAVGMVYEGLMRPAKNPVRKKESEQEVSSNSTEDSILRRIAREYNEYIERRRIQELALISNATVRERIPHPTEEIYQTWLLFGKIFPSLSKLTHDEQRGVFRGYLPKVTMLEGFIRTIRVFGGFGKFMMCSQIMSVNMEMPDEWLPINEGGENRSSLIESMQLFINDQIAIVVPSLERSKITDSEMHALLALILCDSDAKTDSSEPLLNSIRSEVLQDLRRYYKDEMGLRDYSTRLGNLMTICHTVREFTHLFQECFRMQVAIFDLYTSETLIQEYFL